MDADDDLAAFLADRYDEAEAGAKAAAAEGTPEWHIEIDDDPFIGRRVFDARGEVVVYDEGSPGQHEAAHIAGMDPAHRLADIALKRAILAEHDTRGWKTGDRVHDCQWQAWPCRTMRLLGAEFSGHPGYRAEWRPE